MMTSFSTAEVCALSIGWFAVSTHRCRHSSDDRIGDAIFVELLDLPVIGRIRPEILIRLMIVPSENQPLPAE